MPPPATSLHELPAYLLNAVHDFLDSACILAITDVRGAIVFVNDAFVSISGYAREELVGQNHRILKSGQHGEIFYREMWQTIVKGDVWRGEICNRAKDGHLYWVDSTITPILDGQGRIAYYCAMRVDVTEQKRLQSELLARVKQEAKIERTVALGRMADAVCHDMNNLLGSAILMADLLPDTPDSEVPPLRHVLSRMAEIVRNLRDFSTGRPTTPRFFNLAALVKDSCKLAAFQALRNEELALSFRLDGMTDCDVFANEGQILEIVLNLVTNAIEAMKGTPGAAITVSGSVDETGIAHLVFADTGPGVAPEMRDRIFEAYESTKGPGRGLGLPASRALARAHHGDLRLVSSERGAVFVLTLPTARRAAGLPSIPEHTRVLLLMEDDNDVIVAIEEAAGRHGLRVVQGARSEDMVLWVSKLTDSLAGAVLDSSGSSDDYALVGALRTFRSDLPIVLISATLTETGTRPTRHGSVQCLPKPFRVDELMCALKAPQE